MIQQVLSYKLQNDISELQKNGDLCKLINNGWIVKEITSCGAGNDNNGRSFFVTVLIEKLGEGL